MSEPAAPAGAAGLPRRDGVLVRLPLLDAPLLALPAALWRVPKYDSASFSIGMFRMRSLGPRSGMRQVGQGAPQETSGCSLKNDFIIFHIFFQYTHRAQYM